MPRVNVWIPTDLHETLRARLPGLNISATLQEALQGLLRCSHGQLACRACGMPIDRYELTQPVLERFYSDLLWRLRELIDRGGTAEGAARVAKDLAVSYGVAEASQLPLPRPTRSTREALLAARLSELPPAARAARQRQNRRKARA